ncbi:unnamed protein product [Symbiodinium necroappetens]|uniref:Uncharacterized protein n=1 Tax=Symbiodinium necroappetens TaxID=1628268 RepID=A0A812L3U5_9DINO|nr:unnamed protein product [Symbiodinium necroappetens]
MNARLALAFEDFNTWARERRIEHSQPEFCAKMLRDVQSGYAELAMKGHNARVVMAWLADFVLSLRSKLPADQRTERMDEMSKVAFWLAEFFNRMECYGHYLSDVEKVGLQETCVAWLQASDLNRSNIRQIWTTTTIVHHMRP